MKILSIKNVGLNEFIPVLDSQDETIIGEKGPKGDKGDKGDKGEQGPQGERGP